MDKDEDNKQESVKPVTLDGNAVTAAQLNEERNKESVRIIEDKNNPGAFRTLHKING
jgi:hypothetical protein